MKGFLVFLTVWMVGCSIADFILPPISNPWMMFFGYVVGTAGSFAMEALNK